MIDELTALYRANADPAKAAPMAAYMKNKFAFFGIPSPQRRALEREVRGKGHLDEAAVLDLAQACWALPEREFQYFACDELRRNANRLSLTALPSIEALITTKSWWDTVDALTYNIGDLVARNPELRAVMDRWLTGDDMWLARVAILHETRRKDATDADWLFNACLRRAGDRESSSARRSGGRSGSTRRQMRTLSSDSSPTTGPSCRAFRSAKDSSG